MPSHEVKLKTIFIFVLSALFLSGCSWNFDLRRQAGEEKPSNSSMQSATDLKDDEDENFSKESAGEISGELNGPVKILFVGDMMFDRHIRNAVSKYGGGEYNYIFEPLKERLAEYDLVVGNLEGPITENESVSVNTEIGEGKNFVFTFDPAVAKTLADNNVRLVSLGNNHILNQGQSGVEQTKKYLKEVGVERFDEGSSFVKDNIVFVSYNYSVPDSVEAVIEKIKVAKENADIVIVCPHWGTEYKVGDPGQAIRGMAHRFIEAGADLIIGTHPHVVQNSEEYKGKKIYYSLGNFIFDQYFQKETMEGMGVEVTINPDRSMEYDELKFVMNKRGQTEMK